ncbi:MAG: biotin/lipoyl-binding protein [Tannerella sp.]|jgi:biotin carboxyl carrier protein|nr:biotin/lipoyl-binding protein [Tannerella sp.]
MKEFKYTISGNVYNVKVSEIEGNTASVEVNGTSYKVEMDKPVRKQAATIKVPPSISVKPTTPISSKPAAIPKSTSGGSIKSPLPGIVLSIDCKPGDVVNKGQKLLVLEAMKMENNIPSDRDGEIAEIKINKGDSVLEGAEMITFK